MKTERYNEGRTIRLETNPIEDALWVFTLAKLGFKIIALLLFGIYVALKVLL